MVPTVAWMRQKFAEYNAKYFGNKLPIPEFKVEQMTREFGRFYLDARYNKSTRRIISANGNGILYLTSQYSRNENAVISTLLHEMTHEYIYLVMGIYPRNQHGQEFMSIARKINEDGWNIGNGIELTSDDIENNGRASQSESIIFVISTPNRKDFKWWICKADIGRVAEFASAANKIDGVTEMGLFKCKSGALEHVECEPSTLFGWGGYTYAEAVTKMARYCGENPEVFNKTNLIPIK